MHKNKPATKPAKQKNEECKQTKTPGIVSCGCGIKAR